jgi:glucose-6-phosphate 1-dehydrogenase
MSATVTSRPATTLPEQAHRDAQVADVFVIFGITGDLSKVMTFNSLHRLEQRGLLTCPIVGVAVSDWSADDLRGHAREAIANCGTEIDEAVFDRLGAQMSYVSGDFGERDALSMLSDRSAT